MKLSFAEKTACDKADLSPFYREKLKDSEALKRNAAKDEVRVQQLQAEIAQTKQQRVKLAQQIAEKTQQHREWMKEKENHMKKLAKETRAAKLEVSFLDIICSLIIAMMTEYMAIISIYALKDTLT